MGDDNDKEFENIIQDVTDKILQSLSRPIKSSCRTDCFY